MSNSCFVRVLDIVVAFLKQQQTLRSCKSLSQLEPFDFRDVFSSFWRFNKYESQVITCIIRPIPKPESIWLVLEHRNKQSSVNFGQFRISDLQNFQNISGIRFCSLPETGQLRIVRLTQKFSVLQLKWNIIYHLLQPWPR